MAAEDVDVGSCSHIPYSRYTVAAARDEDVEGGVECQGVDTAEMTVVVPYHFVGFEVPAFYHFVFSAGEEIGVARGDGKTSDGGYVACEGQAERT